MLTPMVIASTGGFANEFNVALAHLAAKLSDKFGEPYSQSITTLRCKFAFCLARSALRCLRGSRSVRMVTPSIDFHDAPSRLVAAEACLR